jgi:hypothetical protein
MISTQTVEQLKEAYLQIRKQLSTNWVSPQRGNQAKYVQQHTVATGTN